MEFNHLSVLLGECIEYLDIKPDGIYVDGTLGGAGHSMEILKRLSPVGRLYGIDRDDDAITAATAKIGDDDRFQAIKGNFHDVKQLLNGLGVEKIDGMLLDLGVSSHQLNVRERGFSYHDEADLDMRMDRSQLLTAKEIVNTWSEHEIARILRDYGEENWAVHISRVLVDRRKLAPIETTAQLVNIIDAAIPKKIRAKDGSHPARRTFQALRIAVNDELAPLDDAINDIESLLNSEGRLCIIAFHSLEDRIVKLAFRRLMNPCTCPPKMPICICGKKPTSRVLTGKPVKPSTEEVETNPRSRSATLRVLEKL